MAGSGDPPEGTPEGLPGGGEDEYRSVVFDESFIRAARLQEFSAQERMGEHARAVRSRPGFDSGRRSKQPLLLVLLILLAFGTAIYLGVRNPYQPPAVHRAEPLRTTMTPLAPQGRVPGGEPAELLAHSPAAEYRTGAAGINLPPDVGRTEHFSESQVVTALSVAKDYLVASSLDPDVLAGSTARPVRLLIDPDQLAQFDSSLESPRTDGRHAPAGWLVRFDSAREAVVGTSTRVQGTLHFAEIDAGVLEVTSDHTFTYALRPAVSGSGPAPAASLFTVHREVQFRFDREDLRMHRAELLTSRVEAGPQACAPDSRGTLRPLLAGEQAPGTGAPAVTDPYAVGENTVAPLCGTLSPKAQPVL